MFVLKQRYYEEWLLEFTAARESVENAQVIPLGKWGEKSKALKFYSKEALEQFLKMLEVTFGMAFLPENFDIEEITE